MFLVVGCLIAAYIAKGLLARDEPIAQVESRRIPMALGDLEPGTVITNDHVGDGRIKETNIEPGVILHTRGLIGRVVKDRIPAGTPIQSAQLYPPGVRPALEVAEGMRAVAISVNESTGMVDGLIQPGEHVDIHFTPDPSSLPDDRSRGGLTMTLFRGVKILAINRGVAGSVANSGNSVTLELTPAQANIVNLARDKGKLALSLNPGGKGTGVVTVTDEDRVTLDEILGLKAPEPPAKPFQTEIYRGASRASNLWTDSGARWVGDGRGYDDDVYDDGFNRAVPGYYLNGQRINRSAPNDGRSSNRGSNQSRNGGDARGSSTRGPGSASRTKNPALFQANLPRMMMTR